MRQGQRDYVSILLWAAAMVSAVISAAAFGDEQHWRSLAYAGAVVSAGNAAVLASRWARRARMPGLAVAAAWRATWMAARALSAARQNSQRIEKCESRQRRVLAAIEEDVAEGCGADAPTDAQGLRLVHSARGESEAAG